MFDVTQKGFNLPSLTQISTKSMRGLSIGARAKKKREFALEELNNDQPISIAHLPAPLDSKPCTLLDLTIEICHWPLNDSGEQQFCGAHAKREHSYCHHHHRIAYQPRAA